MIAREYIDKNLQPLPANASVEKSIHTLVDAKLNDTFIYNNEGALLLLSLKDIIDAPAALPAITYASPFEMKITGDMHWSRLLGFFKLFHTEVLPVYNLNFEFAGLISKGYLIANLPDLQVMEEPGAILLLQCDKSFYAASEVVRISEMYNARVITLLTHINLVTDKIEVTLKVNIQETGGLVSTYERFGYEVTNVFMNRDLDKDIYTERYESLLKTLDL